MYKYLLLFVILLFSFSCNKNKYYKYDKFDPKEINISTGFESDTVTIFRNEKNVVETHTVSSKYVRFPEDYFMNYLFGIYQIEIKNETRKIIVTLEVVNYRRDLNMILAEKIFALNQPIYYIVFTKEECYACETIKPLLFRYHDYSLSINYENGIELFSISLDEKANQTIIGKEENIQDVNNVNDLRIKSVPVLIIIKQGKINEYYTGAKDIGTFLQTKLQSKNEE